MALLRAPAIDPESDDFAQPIYEDPGSDYYQNDELLPPLRVPLKEGHTGFIEDANGWVHLIKNGREQGGASRTDHVKKSVAAPVMTLDEVKAKYEQRMKQWRNSSFCTAMIRFFEQTLLNAQSLKLDHCACVGIGTFTGEHPHCRSEYGPLDQLAALETLLEILRQKHNISSVIIQDPVMNSLDAAFLESRGFTAVEHPEAQNRLTPTSLLYAPSCEWHVVKEAFEIAYPTIFIGSRLEKYMDCIEFEQEEGVDIEEDQWQETQRKVREQERRTFERAYLPFCDTRSSRDVVLYQNGRKETVYWKDIIEELTSGPLKTTGPRTLA